MIRCCRRCHNEYLEGLFSGRHVCPPDDRERAVLDAKRWFVEQWEPDVTLLEERLDAALAREPGKWTGPVTVIR